MTGFELLLASIGIIVVVPLLWFVYRSGKDRPVRATTKPAPPSNPELSPNDSTEASRRPSFEPLLLGSRFDAITALGRVNGNAKLYRRLLGRLRLRLKHFGPSLQENLNNSDWAALLESGHSLKGVAATLGASTVADAALLLESTAREMVQGEGTPSRLSLAATALQREINFTDQDLARAGVQCQAPPSKSAPSRLESSNREELRKASHRGNIKALKRLVSQLPENHAVRTAVENYDLAELRRLLK